MPRALGQIDARKAEAVLDAAVQVFSERGLSAPLEAVAAAAGVSKQTIYNQYGCKADLIGALVERRSDQLTSVLTETGLRGRPREALEAFARALLGVYTPGDRSAAWLMRLVVQHAVERPELAQRVYEAGPRASRRRLSAFLEAESEAGRLAIDDPAEAADLFLGMVLGVVQLAALLGAPAELDAARALRRAQTCADRFLKAYAR